MNIYDESAIWDAMEVFWRHQHPPIPVAGSCFGFKDNTKRTSHHFISYSPFIDFDSFMNFDLVKT